MISGYLLLWYQYRYVAVTFFVTYCSHCGQGSNYMGMTSSQDMGITSSHIICSKFRELIVNGLNTGNKTECPWRFVPPEYMTFSTLSTATKVFSTI